jgi:mannose-1-phosphate guanylyltransferase/mannose-6-phosphate isomerase
MSQIFPVILSGGSGTRLWPTSRSLYPKQLLPLASDLTLIQQTAERVARSNVLADRFEPPVIICNEEHRFTIASQLQEIGIRPSTQVLEPEGRNTAPAAAIAALVVSELQGDGLMLILPADHFIEEVDIFHEAIEVGALEAEKGALVTFGVGPTHAETGYGYIRRGAKRKSGGDAFDVSAFTEKPSEAVAQSYVDAGDYYWNSGIFMFRADRLLEEMDQHCSEIVSACRSAIKGGRRDLDFLRLDEKAFKACPSDSIDYAVMEKTDAACVIPASMGWNDVGSWDSLWSLGEKDAGNNVVVGDVVCKDTKNSYIRSQNRLVATLGIEDLVVVETSDAVLVASRERAQDLKKIVDDLKSEGRTEPVSHQRVYRPWGYYEALDGSERYQVKHLMVKPGASLSLQMHHHRAEHWVVVHGTAKVTNGDKILLLSENESTYIPLGAMHRLENPGKLPLSIIEVQAGAYLGEDDIVRFEDVYDRVATDSVAKKR